ncbi:hypothetical protein, partial [Accumulibacter sp.]|uniref:hypothetical protein n=1 Tax=Accumulibacter sp. TaxID=2053492 RepID=UPI0028C38A96
MVIDVAAGAAWPQLAWGSPVDYRVADCFRQEVVRVRRKVSESERWPSFRGRTKLSKVDGSAEAL